MTKKKATLAGILEEIVQSGAVADHLIAELAQGGLIVDSGQRRNGEIVWGANSALSAEELRQRFGALATPPAARPEVSDIAADTAAAFQSLIDDGSIVPHPDGLKRLNLKTGEMEPVYVAAEAVAELVKKRG
jgi:hypothetical protein